MEKNKEIEKKEKIRGRGIFSFLISLVLIAVFESRYYKTLDFWWIPDLKAKNPEHALSNPFAMAKLELESGASSSS